MTLPITYFDPTLAMWPDLAQGRGALAPVRVGVNRKTGQVIVGWDHVRQSIEVILATHFHSRILRRWVGSFVPHILGESGVERIITRFFWAIASALDLNEPGYRIQRVHFEGFAISDPTAPLTDGVELFRLGEVFFRTEGIFMPRGHLGDFTPEQRRKIGLVGRGTHLWDAVNVEGR